MKGFIAPLALFTVLLALCACSVQRIGTDKPSESVPEKPSQTVAPADTGKNSVTDPQSSGSVGNTGATETLSAPQASPSAALYTMTHSEPGTREDYAIAARYEDDMSQGRDLCVLGTFPSSETTLSGKNMGEIWSSCLSRSGLSDRLRPGFLLEFDTPEGHCSKLILRPSDINDAYWDYIETYIYDDIHQTPGAWYSHLLDSEFTDETIITSVKITAGAKIADVQNLTLTVFLYNVGEGSAVNADYALANGFRTEIIPNPARK